MKCIHLGDKAGSLVTSCCGGKEELTDLYCCNSPKQSADWCVFHKGTKGLGEVRRDGEASVATVAVCSGCPYREQIISPHSLPVSTGFMPKGRPTLAWEQLRARRSPPSGINRVTIVNLDNHGYGDACVMAWLTEGTQDHTTRVVPHATGHKKEFLEMLGQQVYPAIPGMVSPSLGFHYERSGSNAPRWVNWCASFGVQPSLVRPKVVIPDDDISWAKAFTTGRLIGLAPQTTHVPREWPPLYWGDLHHRLTSHGFTVAWLGLPDNRYAKFDNLKTLGIGWHRTTALAQQCRCVVGNDSAIAHISGTLNVPTVVVLGPTTEAVFSHMPSVHCVATPKRTVECSGCSYGYGYREELCQRGCAALANISPEQVCEEVVDVVAQSR